MAIFMLFLYMLKITGIYPTKKRFKALLFIPFWISAGISALNINSLEFRIGEKTNYSMGVSVYACFVTAGIYLVLSMVQFFRYWHYMERNKRISLFTYLVVLFGVAIVQFTFPEALVTSIGVTLFVVSVYLNQEDPNYCKLSLYHDEMILDFANLIESRDDNTGGHVKRTSIYVKLIAEELHVRGYYKDVLTKDYITNLIKSAPLHDIGKISVPDKILQKAGKLTEEEYAIMKLHSINGGRIIQETFKNLGNEEYLKTAYEVARHHHEKWNGKGYPDGLKETEIPICARIMAVADVFDAVSEKRCYREAMPLDVCFEIIENGSGQDFDPIVAKVFLDIRNDVEDVHRHFLNDDSYTRVNVKL
jgi:HD-GYP domain-containing protein (c-di-GMP phosphodiesterase class II)